MSWRERYKIPNAAPFLASRTNTQTTQSQEPHPSPFSTVDLDEFEAEPPLIPKRLWKRTVPRVVESAFSRNEQDGPFRSSLIQNPNFSSRDIQPGNLGLLGPGNSSNWVRYDLGGSTGSRTRAFYPIYLERSYPHGESDPEPFHLKMVGRKLQRPKSHES